MTVREGTRGSYRRLLQGRLPGPQSITRKLEYEGNILRTFELDCCLENKIQGFITAAHVIGNLPFLSQRKKGQKLRCLWEEEQVVILIIMRSDSCLLQACKR